MDALYLAELMSRINPGQLDSMLKAATFEPETALNAAAMKTAGNDLERGRSLEDTPMARGYNVGGTYVAASPVEHFANAMRMYRGGLDSRAALDARQKAFADQRANIDAMRGGLGSFLQVAGGPEPVDPLTWSPEPIDVPWQWQAPNFVGR